MSGYATRRARHTGLLAALVVLASLAALGVWHPARVAVQALLLLPSLFPSMPFDPLALVTPAPTEEQRTYAYSAGSVDASLFHPASDGRRHGAMIVMLGAGDLPRSDLAVHFAESLARVGVVTLLPESSGMLAERLTFDEVDAIRTSLDVLEAQDDVDPQRIGLIGLSASGGLSIVAAAQPGMSERVRFVNSFGSYDDTLRLLVDVASRSLEVDSEVREWQPEQRTLEVIGNALEDAQVDASARQELLDGTTRARASQIVRDLPSDARQRLAQVSPATYLYQVHAHLYLMHDVDDSFIPFTESRDLVASAPPGLVQRYTEFSIFAHVIPDRQVPWTTFLPDLWRLFWHVQAVLLEAL